jgi:putative ABC transport system permease protein
MKLTEVFEESILVLKTNKMRTGLSILGIIIGIGSVITLMTLGQASQESVKQRIQSLGSNLLIIRPGSQQEGFLRGESTRSTLTYDDAQNIIESQRITTVGSIATEYSARAQVSFERNNTNIQVTGIAGDYFKLRNVEVSLGSEITNEANVNLEKVVILGPTVVTDLFGENANPLGQFVRIKGMAFKVIGVTKSKGASGMGSSDEVVYVPLFTAQKALFGVNSLSSIYVGAKNEKVMSEALSQVGYYLLELHKKATPADADFSISSQEDLLETVTSVTQTFTTLLTGIAAISLVVGGIGIMNIMLVTVTERTSEIGLKKALGAKRKAIVTQFLVESIILSISGGIIGVIVGVGASVILTKVFSLPSILAVNSIILSVVVSCLVGIVFGWYPAQKASKLQPIEALRYE